MPSAPVARLCRELSRRCPLNGTDPDQVNDIAVVDVPVEHFDATGLRHLGDSHLVHRLDGQLRKGDARSLPRRLGETLDPRLHDPPGEKGRVLPLTPLLERGEVASGTLRASVQARVPRRLVELGEPLAQLAHEIGIGGGGSGGPLRRRIPRLDERSHGLGVACEPRLRRSPPPKLGMTYEVPPTRLVGGCQTDLCEKMVEGGHLAVQLSGIDLVVPLPARRTSQLHKEHATSFSAERRRRQDSSS